LRINNAGDRRVNHPDPLIKKVAGDCVKISRVQGLASGQMRGHPGVKVSQEEQGRDVAAAMVLTLINKTMF